MWLDWPGGSAEPHKHDEEMVSCWRQEWYQQIQHILEKSGITHIF